METTEIPFRFDYAWDFQTDTTQVRIWNLDTHIDRSGLTIDEIPYRRDGSLEKYTPSGDYVVVKFARWAFEKFKGVQDRLGTQTCAVGEVMSIGTRARAERCRFSARFATSRWRASPRRSAGEEAARSEPRSTSDPSSSTMRESPADHHPTRQAEETFVANAVLRALRLFLRPCRALHPGRVLRRRHVLHIPKNILQAIQASSRMPSSL